MSLAVVVAEAVTVRPGLAQTSRGSWTAVAPMPIALAGLAATTGLSGRIFAIGGGFGSCSSPNSYTVNQAEAYDPATNRWSRLTPMPISRSSLAAATGRDGRIYTFGGWNNDSNYYTLNTAEVYDPSRNTWSAIAPMPTAREDPVAATGRDARIYVIGGNTGANGNPVLGALKTVEAYNPATNRWSVKAPMPTARTDMGVATGPDGRIYVVGGVNERDDALNTVQVYNPATNTWRTVAPMPTPLGTLAAATGPDGRIYAIGGSRDTAAGQRTVNTVEAYDTAANRWSTVAPMPARRAGLATATGRDGRIYAMGGYSICPATRAVEAYTPAPLFVRVSLAHQALAAGQLQTATITTWPAAQIAITVTFPDHGSTRRTGTAGARGVFIWTFRQPRVAGSGGQVAHVTVTAHTPSGASATAQNAYRIR